MSAIYFPKKFKNYFIYLIPALAGALLTFAFAPSGWWWLAMLMPAVLLAFLQIAKQRSLKQTLLVGYSFGLGFFATSVSWVFVSIYEFGNQNIFVSCLLTALLISFMALYFLLISISYFYLASKRSISFNSLLLFPSLWLLAEWLRSFLLTGFPWILIGFSQTNSPLRGWIPIGGEYLVGFAVLMINGLIYQLITLINHKRFEHLFKIFSIHLLGLVLLLGSGLWLSQKQWTKPTGKVWRVALVQGDIAQTIKWSPAYIDSILNRYVNLTSTVSNADLIVWPEGAIPIVSNQASELLTQLNQEALSKQMGLLTGIPVQVPGSFNNYYNAFIGIGRAQGIYYKRFLVPFGEYVPFQQYVGNLFQWLNIPMSSFIPGPYRQANLLVNQIPIAPFICYEIAYDNALRTQLPKAQLLVVVSDDAWFGHSLAPAQHLQIGEFRALETGRQLLFVGNNGITAIINTKGIVVNRIRQFIPAVLKGDAFLYQGATPWIIFGNWPIIAILLMIIVTRMIYLKFFIFSRQP